MSNVKRIDLTKRKVFDHRGNRITSVTLKELLGPEEDDAMARVFLTPDGKQPPAGMVSSLVRKQTIATAIVKVNDEDVVPPYVDWINWPVKTRDYVTIAFNRMNEIAPDELQDFLEATFGPTERGELEGSASGAGSPGT